MALVILIIIVTFGLRQVWWAYIDVFFAFMMVFSQLVSLYIEPLSLSSAKKLRNCAMLFGVLMILSLIGEFIAFQAIG